MHNENEINVIFTQKQQKNSQNLENNAKKGRKTWIVILRGWLKSCLWQNSISKSKIGEITKIKTTTSYTTMRLNTDFDW